MNRLKRLIAGGLSLVLISSMILTGCGANSSNSTESSSAASSSSTTASQETTQAEPTLAPVELSYYYVGGDQPEKDLVYEEVNKILKEKINATVKFNLLDWGAYDEKMKVMIAAAQEFDMCYTADWMNDYKMNVSKGAFLAIDDLLDKYAPTLKATVPQDMWSGVKVAGKTYGVINYQIATMKQSVYLLKDLVDKYGFDISSIKKVQDIEPFLKNIKEKDPQVTSPLNMTYRGLFGEILTAYGLEEAVGRDIPGAIYISDTSAKAINQYETPEFKENLAMVRDWQKKGYIRKDALSIKDTTDDMKAGKIGVNIGGYKPGIEGDLKASYGQDYVVTPIGEGVTVTANILGSITAISATSKNPERAMMYLELINSDKQLYNTLCFGIEGKHYKKVSDNQIEKIADSKYWPNTAWEFGCQFNAYLLPGQAATVWDDTKKLNQESKKSPLLGFSFNSEPVKSEIAQCKSVTDEFVPAMTTGAMDPDEALPKFLDKLKKAGSEKIVAELQKQIDAWKATR